MTVLRRHRIKKKYYKTIILLITIMVITFIILTSFSVYRFMVDTITENKYQSDMQMLTQIKYMLEKHNDDVRNTCVELFNNSDSAAIMNTQWDESQMPEIYRLAEKVKRSVAAQSPFVNSIYFYNDKTRRFYSNYFGPRTVVDVFLMEALHRYAPSPLLKPLLRKSNVNDVNGYSTEYVLSYVMHEKSSLDGQLGPAIVLNVKLDYFMNEIRSVAVSNPQPGDFFALITDDGVWFPDQQYGNSDALVKNLTCIFLSDIMAAIHSGSKVGILTETIDNAKYFISFIRLDGTNMTIIKSQPYEDLFKDIINTKFKIITITVIAVVAAILASILLAWRIYKPINNLVKLIDNNAIYSMSQRNYNEMDFIKIAYINTLQKLQSAQTWLLHEKDLHRQDFLIRLLRGTVSANELKLALEEGLAHVDMASPFYLWIIKIDSDRRLSELGSRDYNLFKYAIGNIMSELISERYVSDLFELDNDSFAAFVSGGEAKIGEIYREFARTAKEGQQAILGCLDIYVSISISSCLSDYLDLLRQYAQTEYNLQYRVIYGKMCVIYPDMISANNQYKQFKYPFALEDSLLNEIRLGNLPKMEAKLDLIISEIRKMDYNSIMISIMRLCNMVYDILAELYQNSFVPVPNTLNIIGMNYFEQYTISDIRSKIWIEIERATLTTREKSNANKRNIVNAVSVLISENFQDPNLCLNSIAKALDKTPNYIGNIYKESTGKSIAQSILETRLNKAVELIMTTDDSIMKIIESTGFLNESGFYKNFKKYYSTTPNNYKLKHIVDSERSKAGQS